ncbi:MAG: glycosyltransferase, partial [Bacteroidales bacterium]|nr:glycosyltransferase [Bacteroidales bacterium]
MKILLINSNFEQGGATRVATIMCNGFYEKGYMLWVVTDNKHSKISYDLNPNISLLPLYHREKNMGWFAKLSLFNEAVHNIRRYIKKFKPDVIISVEAYTYIRILLANSFLDYPVIIADHTSFNRKINRLIDLTRYHLYKYADGISILTEKDKNILGAKYPQKEVIYNPLPFPVLNNKTVRRKNVLCAGRLDVWHIKGIDIILDIWEDIAERYEDWTLEIAGGGSESSNTVIIDMIESRHLTKHVKLLGLVNDMQNLYQETSIFVLSSRVEGFPMVLMEAMSQGCASVAFEMEGATNEMVCEGAGCVIKDGDIVAFKEKLIELIEDENKRETMSTLAIDSVKRF